MYFQMPEQSNKNCGEQILMIRERNILSEELDFFFLTKQAISCLII